MKVGKTYPLWFNAHRRAISPFTVHGLPRRFQAGWNTIVEPLFQPLDGIVSASGLAVESADGQSMTWEFAYDDPPGTVLRLTHHLTEDLTPEPGQNVLQDTFDFELSIGATVYGTNRRITVPTQSLLVSPTAGPTIGMPLVWENLHDPDEFRTATLRFAAGTWAMSPEYTPYVTHP